MFWKLLKKSDVSPAPWASFWVSYSIGLCVWFCAWTMLFLLLWLWVSGIIWGLILWFLQSCSFCSGLLLILGGFFVVFCFYVSIWIFNIFGGGIWTQGLHLDSLHQPFLWWVFFQDRVLWTICLKLASNHDLPDVCLLSS
jgi:hypothetical protein